MGAKSYPEAMELASGAGSRMREPKTTLWKVLKVIFIVLNVFSAISVAVLVIACVGLTSIVARKMEAAGRPNDERDLPDGKLMLTVTVAFMTSQTFLTIVGFIGICRPHLGALWTYTAIVLIYTVFLLLLALLVSFSYGLISNLAILVMMYLLISELKKAN